MNWSDVFAGLSAVVAILAALYSRWSAKAAQRANEIAVHNERLRIYKGLLNFRAVLTTKGPGFPDEALWEFADVVDLSEFYFSKAIHEAMQKLLTDGNTLKARHVHWQNTNQESGRDSVAEVAAMHELHRKTRDECGTVADKLKPYLRLETSKPNWLV